MNKLKFVLLVFVAITLNCNRTFAAESDSLLVNIQKKIYNSFLSTFNDGNADKLVNIQKALAGLKQKNQIITYWEAYGKYYESLYYLKTSDKEKAMSKLNDAIKALDNVKDKNSESLALLAYLQNFSIQYLGSLSAASIGNKVKSNAQLALQLDSTNLRAWYVLASNDYYTPIAFGGGKKCEKHLLKAVSLNEQTIPNTYMPSWGKAEAYSLLIDFYYNKEDYKRAKEILSQALACYPTDYMINQYIAKLKDK